MPPAAAPQHQEQQSASLLLALPDPCLLAVLQCLAAANDHCSLFSAARAHSKLHQAAAVALSSMTVWAIRQQVLDGVLLYLSRHGQHVSSLSLSVKWGHTVTLRQLPPNLHLGSLKLHGFDLQLSPGVGCQGVLGPAAGLAALKQLRLNSCTLLDAEKGLAAALQQLPAGLEHLSIGNFRLDDFARSRVAFPTSTLQRLQQLTHLDVDGVKLQGADQSSSALQPLQALSRLVDLRLTSGGNTVLTRNMLAGAVGLTRLELYHFSFQPGVLAGQTQLQHLKLIEWEAPADAAWTAQLLSSLGALQQLTYLECFRLTQATSPPAAYSALTASSKLVELDISRCALPAGVWQHVFPAGRQLQHLTSLTVSGGEPRDGPATGPYMAAPEGSLLVSCCPGLRWLDVSDLTYSAGAFGPLSALSGLHMLTVSCSRTGEGLREIGQLTGLRQLSIRAWGADGLLLQMTQLRRLTALHYSGPLDGRSIDAKLETHGPGDEPVWRRVLRRHLKHSDPAVAQAAAAALAEAE